MSDGFNYDVFISYRHRPLDNVITKAVFNALESYRLPKPIRARGCRDIQRVFRDTEELSVGKILTETIDDALRSSNCLIVICTTDAPLSPWVDREISMFINMGRGEHIYPLLVNGDPATSFPPSLSLLPDLEERVMDVRSEGSDPKKIMARAETALLKAIADVAGCEEEELVREHTLRRNRRTAARTGAAAAVLAAVLGVSAGLLHLASTYRDTAKVREEASMRILNELTYSLPDHLTNVPGAYAKIAGILRRNTEDLNAIARLSDNRQAAEFEVAANYEKLASAGGVLGAYEEALISEETAIGLFGTLADEDYEGSRAALASAYNNRGGILNSAGRYSEAAEDYSLATELTEALEEPDTLTLGRMYYNAGANAVSYGDVSRAAELFEKSLDLLGSAERTPVNIESMANAYYNYGVLLYREADYTAAAEKLSNACDLIETLNEVSDSLQNRSSYTRALTTLATCMSDLGRFEDADYYYAQAAELAEELARDDDNMEFQLLLANICNNRGTCFNTRGDYLSADVYFAQASEVYRRIMERTGSASDTAYFALSLLNTGENAFKAGQYERSRGYFESGLDYYAGVCESLGTYDTAQYYAWLSYYDLIHLRDYDAALDDALIGREYQPDGVLVNMNLAYACLYAGYYEDALDLFIRIASLGEGQAEMIRLDLEAQERAGLHSGHAEEIIETILP